MKADPHPTGAALLIVEDDAATRHLIQSHLQAHGYQVAEAGSAREALRAWDARRPDLIVLDLGLPDADGQAVIRRVRRDATTPILVLSARGAEADKVRALEAGADDYVTKPFGSAELRAADTWPPMASTRPLTTLRPMPSPRRDGPPF